jgi:beta-lactamase regulating signal transducer with metallopeptidase domain
MTSLFEWRELSVLEWHIIGASIKGTLILIIAAALCLSLRRGSAAVRHFVWSLALTGLLALPLLSIGLPDWQIAVLPASSIDSQSPATSSPEVAQSSHQTIPMSRIAPAPPPTGSEAKAVSGKPINLELKTDLSAGESSPATTRSVEWVKWALFLWLAVAGLLLLRLLIGITNIWWIAHRAYRVMDNRCLKFADDIASQIGLARKVPILKSSRTSMPVTCGVIRPRILLPADSDDWPYERLQVVLLHELAHVKRWDCLTQLLGQTACSLYWFNPLVWIASRQLRIERERACDDQVIDLGTKASDYAGHLLEMARTFRTARCSSLATLAIARRSQLEGRLVAILDPGPKRRGLNRIAAVVVATVIVCVVLPLATVRLSAQTNGSFREPMSGLDPQSANPNLEVDSLGVPSVQPRVEVGSPPASQSDDASSNQEANNSDGSVQQPPGGPVIDALREAIKDDDPEVRQHALFALAQVGDEPAQAALIDALKDPSWQVRANAATGLGLRGDRNGVDALVSALRDSNWQVREQAAWALGLRGDARAIEPLVEAVKDESAGVREKAAWALGLKGNRQAVEALIAALTDATPRVRGMAAWALGLKGDSRAGDALKSALKDPDNGVRQKAAWALGMLLMKLGGAPVGVPGADDDVDRETKVNRDGVPGGVNGGVPSSGVERLGPGVGKGDGAGAGAGRGDGAGAGIGKGDGTGAGIGKGDGTGAGVGRGNDPSSKAGKTTGKVRQK